MIPLDKSHKLYPSRYLVLAKRLESSCIHGHDYVEKEKVGKSVISLGHSTIIEQRVCCVMFLFRLATFFRMLIFKNLMQLKNMHILNNIFIKPSSHVIKA